ncbi:hypothetical protein Q1W73_06935 [Asticcacaulis sp. ZE23SCel15]|uniref:hypothetical protein n=1 Tax=Asticcacaulis sp. ZE23SCel15 TaxID=3059027 RepID=UPI00265FE7F9|nr:hypothetical protein [Asticcacaulis sp. ZE23SCel15]WKL58714.1 hypothetical protein Q1W73_06935 [Asticcacaulis sp. ZE23SCel15]
MKLYGIAIILGLMAASSPVWAQTATETKPAEEAKAQDGTQSSQWMSDVKGDNLQSAVMTPMTDLNLRKLEIPEILLKASVNAYDLTGMDTCQALGVEISQLSDVLGIDFDAPALSDSRSLTDKAKHLAGHATVGAVRDASGSLVPFRGIVRKVSGADKYQNEIDTAIEAGRVRRAYLKGVGINKNCAPPAAPLWFVPEKATAKSAPKPQTKPKAKTKR